MKILMIGPFPKPLNGMSIANDQLARGLSGRGHSVSIINTNTSIFMGDLRDQGRFTIKKIFASLRSIAQGINAICFSKKKDVLYLTPGQSEYGYLKYVPFILLANMRSIPVFIHIHGGFFRVMFDVSKGWKKYLIRVSMQKLSGAIVLGPSLRYMFANLIPEEKIFECPNAVDTEIIATDVEIEEKIAAFKMKKRIDIVYLSNLKRSKGILDLLEAIVILKRKGVDVHLDIAGEIEPDIKNDLDWYFSKLKNTISYHGIVEGKKKKKILLKNDYFCLPTYYPYEGQPISIIEAMANGCIILTTDHGGISDLIQGEYGVYIRKKDPTSIVDVLMDKNAIYNVKKAQEIVTQKYKIDSLITIIENIFTQK